VQVNGPMSGDGMRAARLLPYVAAGQPETFSLPSRGTGSIEVIEAAQRPMPECSSRGSGFTKLCSLPMSRRDVLRCTR